MSGESNAHKFFNLRGHLEDQQHPSSQTNTSSSDGSNAQQQQRQHDNDDDNDNEDKPDPRTSFHEVYQKRIQKRRSSMNNMYHAWAHNISMDKINVEKQQQQQSQSLPTSPSPSPPASQRQKKHGSSSNEPRQRRHTMAHNNNYNNNNNNNNTHQKSTTSHRKTSSTPTPHTPLHNDNINSPLPPKNTIIIENPPPRRPSLTDTFISKISSPIHNSFRRIQSSLRTEMKIRQRSPLFFSNQYNHHHHRRHHDDFADPLDELNPTIRNDDDDLSITWMSYRWGEGTSQKVWRWVVWGVLSGLLVIMVWWTTDMAEIVTGERQPLDDAIITPSKNKQPTTTTTSSQWWDDSDPMNAILPPAPFNLVQLCARNPDGQFMDIRGCSTGCRPASCCLPYSTHSLSSSSSSSTAFDNSGIDCRHEERCRDYMTPCSQLPVWATGTHNRDEGFDIDDEDSINGISKRNNNNRIPAAPAILDRACSPTNMAYSREAREMCINLCHVADCCVGRGDPLDCDTRDKERLCAPYVSHCGEVWSATDEDGGKAVSSGANDLPKLVDAVDDDRVVPYALSYLCSSHQRDDASSSPSEDCITACRPAYCCSLPPTDPLSCQADSLCGSAYLPCPTVIPPPPVVETLPSPPSNVGLLCDDRHISASAYHCQMICRKGLCCFVEETHELSCFGNFPTTCEEYVTACETIISDDKGLLSLGVDPLKPPLELLCHPLTVSRNPDARRLCRAACEPGACCFDDPPNNCYEGNDDICDTYDPCRVLVTVPSPQKQLSTVCEMALSDEATTRTVLTIGLGNDETPTGLMRDAYLKCMDLCRPAACCFLAGIGNCRNTNELQCSRYEEAGCDKLPPYDGHDHSPLARVCSRRNVRSEKGRSDCLNQCDKSRCCFVSDKEGGCRQSDVYFCRDYVSHCEEMLFLDSDEKNEHHSLSKLCGEESLKTREGREQCEEECLPASCCWIEGFFGCQENKEEFCKMTLRYCDNLLKFPSGGNKKEKEGGGGDVVLAIDDNDQASAGGGALPMAPDNINSLCTDRTIRTFTGMRNCQLACAPSGCCLEYPGCYDQNREACESFGICERLVR